jgi:ABC-type uncharacterized transport system ATPase component
MFLDVRSSTKKNPQLKTSSHSNLPYFLGLFREHCQLDQKNSALVFDKFKELCSSQNQTLLIVTHYPEFAKKTDRII